MSEVDAAGTMIAPRMDRFAPSPTTAMSQRARELQRAGHDVIKLSSGEPDLETPQYVRDAAKAAIDEGLTKSTNVDGLPELKEAIARKFKRDNGLDYGLDEIIVGTGAKQVIYNALLATVGEGDEVIIPAPYWVSYPDIVKLAGGTPVFADCKADNGFVLTAEQLEAAITPATKWLVINNPNNPSGAVWDASTLASLADVLKRYHKVHVLTDDIYEHLSYDNAVVQTLAAVAPELKPRILTVNGVSKAYAMSGWRIGFAGGPAWLIKAMGKLQSQVTSNPAAISQRAAMAALDGSLEEIAKYRDKFRSRRDMMIAAVRPVPHLRFSTPRGAFYIFADCTDAIGLRSPSGTVVTDDIALSEYLLDEYGLAVVPGSAFGMKNHIRLSYSVSSEIIETAGKRLNSAMSALQ